MDRALEHESWFPLTLAPASLSLISVLICKVRRGWTGSRVSFYSIPNDATSGQTPGFACHWERTHQVRRPCNRIPEPNPTPPSIESAASLGSTSGSKRSRVGGRGLFKSLHACLNPSYRLRPGPGARLQIEQAKSFSFPRHSLPSSHSQGPMKLRRHRSGTSPPGVSVYSTALFPGCLPTLSANFSSLDST